MNIKLNYMFLGVFIVVLSIATIASITAALINEPTLSTVFGIGMSTVLGLTLAKANWPRTPFILGFVIAPMFERSTRLSLTFYGMDVFSRPLFWVMLLINRRPAQMGDALGGDEVVDGRGVDRRQADVGPPDGGQRPGKAPSIAME